jgi:predicted PurR-regulated permease PerM
MWTAITALSLTITAAIVIGVIYLATQIIAFLQPILIPFAIAAVMAYLLEPVVAKLMQWGIRRQLSIWLVFFIVTAALIGISFLVIPKLIKQGGEFLEVVPGYLTTAERKVTKIVKDLHDKLKEDYKIEIFDFILEPATKDAPVVGVLASTATERPPIAMNEVFSGTWIKDAVTQIVPTTWGFVTRSVGGFLGVFGFLLSMVIVPLYLYYFLTESAVIARRWSEFVPLRASKFKDEVVGTITEINGYLMAFFRGQLLVSVINGLATSVGLFAVGLKFGWLIGLSLCLLGMIPYLGIIMCWVPAVIIASVQGGDGTWVTDDPWWVFPLVVTGIFFAVQQFDGLFVTPKIVGESVGLHPMTVIMSVFLWSLIMGGLLGAILAVPMTASVKVLFQRYVWNRALHQVEAAEIAEAV